MKNTLNVGDKVLCIEYGRNNSEMIVGEKYEVSEVDADGMIKLYSHPDWWSPERFKKIKSGLAIDKTQTK
jgi:hypothetical protein